MILAIHGTTDAKMMLKILRNSGYHTNVMLVEERGPYKEIWLIEVEEEHV